MNMRIVNDGLLKITHIHSAIDCAESHDQLGTIACGRGPDQPPRSINLRVRKRLIPAGCTQEGAPL
jgi:hypothetical protein